MESPEELAQMLGDPYEKWEAIVDRVQGRSITRFDEVEDAWLDLMWTLDAYRSRGVLPDGVPRGEDPAEALESLNRGKGNWFATLLALLLENRTGQRLAPRARIEGFSQYHQIDVAWPDRGQDPLICLETKVMGSSAKPGRRARPATGDWTNRRKELKFSATDLKLYRWQGETKIEHWDVWRGAAFPRCYFVWAARMSERDRIDHMVDELRKLTGTYLDGAAVVAWEERDGRYHTVALPPFSRVTSVDDMLLRISAEISSIAPPGQLPPPAVVPPSRSIDVDEDVE